MATSQREYCNLGNFVKVVVEDANDKLQHVKGNLAISGFWLKSSSRTVNVKLQQVKRNIVILGGWLP